MLLSQSQINLHTHSFYCRHGSGTIADYVESAIGGNLKLLGFSEHCPLPDNRKFAEGKRMDYDELPLYEADVRSIRDDRITVLLGAECDWLAEELSFYRDDLLNMRGYDYLCCSVHHMFDPTKGRERFLGSFTSMTLQTLSEYVKLYTEALRSGIFLFGCHPDIFLAGYRRWDADAIEASKDIIMCAKECDIPLEVNDNGLRKKFIETEDGKLRHPYPVEEFWELAFEAGVKIIANSDAHTPDVVASHNINAFAFAEKLGLEFASYEFTDGKISII